MDACASAAGLSCLQLLVRGCSQGENCLPEMGSTGLASVRMCPLFPSSSKRMTRNWHSSSPGRLSATVMRPVASVGGGDRDLVGDVGSRDPFPAEVASGFGEKVLGNADTEHKILLPKSISAIAGLAAKKCEKLPADAKALSREEAATLLRKVVGWKIVEAEGGALKLRGEWKLRNFTAGLQLFERIAAVAEAEGHHPDLHLENWNSASVEIWSHSVGGLTENDFILAAKVDLVETKDLIRKPKFWA
eukprot:TRINITY_DN4644_c0_g1_i1.p1 TRINITY_DN4644_c0_g1~~TRINITY_DN4644_c0_g1_i1.p1  ORF type:complete len:264 (-),score=63.74 TRINITY_DN4644_c0_g1_i1:227-967(-)